MQPQVPPLPPEAVEVFDRARAAEKNPPRKHHLVPKSYLRRWEDAGRLRVTDLKGPTSWVTSAAKALRETDFYSMASDDLDANAVPPLLMETIISELESAARPALDRLIDAPAELPPEGRFAITQLMAFQFTRGRALREELKFLGNEFFKLKYGRLSEDGIRAELLRRGADPTPELVEGSKRFLEEVRTGKQRVEPGQPQLANQAAEFAVDLGRYLFARVWVICSTPAMLPTIDEPVVPLEGPGAPREERGGVGTAGVVLFPVSPSRLLVMVRPDVAAGLGFDRGWDVVHLDSLNAVEVVEVAHELIAHADRYVVERPARRLGPRLPVGPLPQAAQFDEVMKLRDGDREGSLIRLSKRNRWAAVPRVPPWPVARWWD